MLLTLRAAVGRRLQHDADDPRDDRRADREAGNALATVIAIVAITGIIAATLLATTMFSTGYASANRAAVQAQAAAEGGVDYALQNMGACAGGIIASPVGTTPVFRVTVDYRLTSGIWEVDQCPTPLAAQVRLTSTGTAPAPGVDGQTRGNTRVVEAIAKPLPALTAGTSLRVDAPLSVVSAANGGALADISVEGSFTCADTKPVLTHTGNLYVDGTYTPKTPCRTSGEDVVGDFDPSAPAFTYPRITRADSRWWGRYPVPVFRDFVKYWTDEQYNFCNFFGYGPRSSDSPLGVIADSRADCPQGVYMRAPKPGEPYPLVVTLSGDVTLIVNKLTLDGQIRFEADPNTTGEFAVSIVSPWPSTATGCPAVPQADVTLLNGGFSTGPRTRVLLYSANGVQLGPSTVTGTTQQFTGQIVGCGVSLQDPTVLTYAPVGRNMAAPTAMPPMQVVSKRDITK